MLVLFWNGHDPMGLRERAVSVSSVLPTASTTGVRANMTIGDLFSGAWTWVDLFGEVFPIFLVAFTAFWAGYERGTRKAVHYMAERYLTTRRKTMKPSRPAEPGKSK